MPAQVYEHALDLTADVVETVPFNTTSGRPTTYPWLPLRKTGKTDTMTFPVVVLENSFVRLKVMPTLGGRIIEWHDKRTMSDIIPKVTEIVAVESGDRGVEVRQGIEFLAGQGERMNRMGTVDFQLREPDDEESPAALFIHELVTGQPLSWTGCLTLYPDSAALVVDLKVQNRALEPIQADHTPFETGLMVWAGAATKPVNNSEFAFYDSQRDTGFGLFCEEGWVVGEVTGQGQVKAWSPSARSGLGPRRVDEWKLRLVPYSGLKHCDVAGPIAAGSLSNEELRIQVSKLVHGGKTFLKTKNDQTFEAPAEMYPETVSVSNLSNLPSPPVAFLLRDMEKEILLEYDESVRDLQPRGEMDRAVTAFNDAVQDEWSKKLSKLSNRESVDFRNLSRVPGLESAVSIAQAHQAIPAKDWLRADSFLEKALAYNADDVLAWWLKATIKREGNIDQDQEQLELMNAHFLAPLEPALRAEGFLSQPQSEFTEGNPMTKPLADNPDAAIDVCCLLLGAGLVEGMSKLADEILRHAEIPTLRYLVAFALLEHSRMEASAAEQVGLAGRLGLEPPFPWRPMEWKAIKRLADRFPDDSRLRQLLTFA